MLLPLQVSWLLGNLEVWISYGLILNVLPCVNCFTVLFVILRLIIVLLLGPSLQD